MRLIDADAMIDRLKKWDTKDKTDKALYNFTLNRINEQPTIQPEPHWIPCSERLPEDGKEVYVTSGKGRWAYTTEGKYSRKFGGWVSAWDNGDLPDVVAWMPLPDPYNAERWKE